MLGSQSTAKVIGVKYSSSIMPKWTSDSLFTYNANLYRIKKQAFSSAFSADRILNSVSLVTWVRKSRRRLWLHRVPATQTRCWRSTTVAELCRNPVRKHQQEAAAASMLQQIWPLLSAVSSWWSAATNLTTAICCQSAATNLTTAICCQQLTVCCNKSDHCHLLSTADSLLQQIWPLPSAVSSWRSSGCAQATITWTPIS